MTTSSPASAVERAAGQRLLWGTRPRSGRQLPIREALTGVGMLGAGHHGWMGWRMACTGTMDRLEKAG